MFCLHNLVNNILPFLFVQHHHNRQYKYHKCKSQKARNKRTKKCLGGFYYWDRLTTCKHSPNSAQHSHHQIQPKMCKKEFKYKCTKGASPHVNIYWMLEGPHKIHLTNGDVYHINVLSACLDRKSRELWMVSSIYFQSCGVFWLNFILYSGSFSLFLWMLSSNHFPTCEIFEYRESQSNFGDIFAW